MKKTVLTKAILTVLPVLGLFAQPVTAEENIHFSSCTEAWENGYSDIHRGEPGYSSKLDRDGDGIACERANAPRGVFKPRQSNPQNRVSSSGWVKQDGYWYYYSDYLKANGKMAQSEWIYDSSYQSWYYLKSDGSYARNTWQRNYYLKSDGKMAKNERVDGGRYYVDGSGLWRP